jgi:hypothetical protein
LRTGRRHLNLRPRLSYADVAATIALVLAVGGGTVYAAAQIGKNDVRSRNLAPGAVKRSDLGKNAVTSAKVRNRTIREADIAAGVVQNDIADVTGSASGGPTAIPTPATVPVPLSGTTTFTPKPGRVSALVLEAQFTLVGAGGMSTCSPSVGLLANGEFTRARAETQPTSSTAPATQLARGADAPFVLINPGNPITITAEIDGDTGCSPDTRLDRLEIRVVEMR